MELEPLPLNEFSLVELPVCLKSGKSLPNVIGEKEQFVSSCRQGNDITISIFPDNPLMGRVSMHSAPSNKLVLKITKEGDSVSGSIIGKGLVGFSS